MAGGRGASGRSLAGFRGHWSVKLYYVAPLVALALAVATALLLALTLITPALAYADGDSAFSGVIEDASGNPAPHVDVMLQSAGIVYERTGTADDGSFSLTVLPGIYSLTIDDETHDR